MLEALPKFKAVYSHGLAWFGYVMTLAECHVLHHNSIVDAKLHHLL